MRSAWQERTGVISVAHDRRDGWTLFLFLNLALVPVVVPTGPAQSAIIDIVSIIALPVFAASVLVRRIPVVVPFLVPVFMIGLGSIIATINAISVGTSLLAMLQDVYLFVWFVALVNVLRDRRDLTAFRVTWLWVANAIALYGLGRVMVEGHLSVFDMLKPRGMRAVSTFYDPNMCADYLVLSFFVVLSLGEEVGWLLRWVSMGLLLMGIVATKSNGGLTALAVGLVAWMLARIWTMRVSIAGLLGFAMLSATVILGGFLLVDGFGVGQAQLTELTSGTVLGRASHSSKGRFQIWKELLQSYSKKPLGLGPGNSALQPLPMEERERPTSLLSKEAHNDYVGYLVERGPLALIGLVLLRLQALFMVITWWRTRRREGSRTGGALTAALIGALAAGWIHSFTLERLHFRHWWLLLAMICALDGMVFRPRRSERRHHRPVAEPSPGPVAAVAR
jgi:O-antigen ligase